MDILIRDYMPSDRDAINDVAQAAFAQYEHDYDDWPSFSAGIGRMADLSSGADVLVAVHGGEVAGGVAHIRPGIARSPVFPDDWSVIRMLVVAPPYRGRGIGGQLVGACLLRACRDRAPMVGLHTSPIMVSALRLYGSLGFQHDGDLPPLRGVPYARYVLPAASIPSALRQLGV